MARGSAGRSSRSGRRVPLVAKIIGIGALAIVAFVLVAASVNLILTRQEKSRFVPYGERVSVDGGEVNVWRNGHAGPTMVLLSGLGTAAPALDFAPLIRQLGDYNVFVVEGFGYGYSDMSARPRTVQNITAELHDVLSKLGAPKPYILVGHSIAGFYTLSYAHRYPDEVSAVVGIDPTVPAAKARFWRDVRLALPRAGNGPQDERHSSAPRSRSLPASPSPKGTPTRPTSGRTSAPWRSGTSATLRSPTRRTRWAATPRPCGESPIPTICPSSSFLSSETAWRPLPDWVRAARGPAAQRPAARSRRARRRALPALDAVQGDGRQDQLPSSTPISRAAAMTEGPQDMDAELRAAEVSIVTTEHFALQAARSATIAESTGRANVFLGAVSGGLVALGLIASATGVGAAFTAFGLVLLPTLSFLGLVTFERVLQSGIEDHFYGRRIAQLRSYYFDRSPGLTRYMFSVPPEGRLQMQGLPVRRSHDLLTVAGMVAVITSVLAGSAVALLAAAVSAPFSVLRSCVRRAGWGRDPWGVDARTAPDLDTGQRGGDVRGGGAGRGDASALARTRRHPRAELETSFAAIALAPRVDRPTPPAPPRARAGGA